MHAKTAGQLGHLVRACRHVRKVRQIDVAQQAGVGRQWIIALEAGRSGLDLDLVLKVYDSLGLKISVYPTPETPPWIDELVWKRELGKMTGPRGRPRDRVRRRQIDGEGDTGLAPN